MVGTVHDKELNEVFTGWKSSDTTRFAAVSHRLPIFVVQLWALQPFLLLLSCCLSFSRFGLAVSRQLNYRRTDCSTRSLCKQNSGVCFMPRR